MSNGKIKILWADDEIDLLKPHILFLEQKGYILITVNDGNAAIAKTIGEKPDIIFLDENMPGISGLETLKQIIGGELTEELTSQLEANFSASLKGILNLE